MGIQMVYKLNFFFSPKAPLYDISGHEEKIFSVDWSLKTHIVSGSADNTIKIFKSST